MDKGEKERQREGECVYVSFGFIRMWRLGFCTVFEGGLLSIGWVRNGVLGFWLGAFKGGFVDVSWFGDEMLRDGKDGGRGREAGCWWLCGNMRKRKEGRE